MAVLRILHVAGSAYNDFYCKLSRDYAHSCLLNTANPSLYDFLIAYITPDLQWRFPASLNPEDIAVAKPIPLFEAIQFITAQNIDLVLPQMFCIPGMTHYRALFDLLKIPYIGNTPDIMAIAAHKARAKAIVEAAGVKVPRGELLRQGDIAGARLYLEHLSAAVDFRLAETYDPERLAAWLAVGIPADPKKARELYERALAGGLIEAQERLARLPQ